MSIHTPDFDTPLQQDGAMIIVVGQESTCKTGTALTSDPDPVALITWDNGYIAPVNRARAMGRRIHIENMPPVAPEEFVKPAPRKDGSVSEVLVPKWDGDQGRKDWAMYKTMIKDLYSSKMFGSIVIDGAEKVFELARLAHFFTGLKGMQLNYEGLYQDLDGTHRYMQAEQGGGKMWWMLHHKKPEFKKLPGVEKQVATGRDEMRGYKRFLEMGDVCIWADRVTGPTGLPTGNVSWTITKSRTYKPAEGRVLYYQDPATGAVGGLSADMLMYETRLGQYFGLP